MENKKKVQKRSWFPLAGAVFVFILCFCILYLGENMGVSDNGDFRRVMLVNRLEYADDTDYYYLFKEHYNMEIQGNTHWERVKFLWGTSEEEHIYSSPHFVMIKISKLLNYLANCVSRRPEETYHIGWLAVIYISMLSMAAWSIFNYFDDSSKRMKITIFAAFVLIFCDSGYILYFNSLYGEPLQYVTLMAMISTGLLIYKRPSIPKVICFYVFLYFFAGAKLANVVYSAVIACIGVIFIVLRKDKLFRIGVMCSAFVSVVLIFWMYTTIPDWMNNDTSYQAVFYGITKDSPEPEKDLHFLGIDEKYAPLANTHAYMQEDEYPMDIRSEEFKRDFYDKISKWKIEIGRAHV